MQRYFAQNHACKDRKWLAESGRNAKSYMPGMAKIERLLFRGFGLRQVHSSSGLVLPH